ncbi:MAG: class I SAM-dependent RNA methyltransferase [Gemmatimonadetes bacterium]|nr:class I SAM-dependent RNA methyltransferase [Gemmatimonadota bacterium]
MPLPAILPCWAVTAPGAELLAAAELRALGIEPGEGEPGGVPFEATAAQLADALLWLRTAVRVTVRLASFTAKSFAELERHGKGVDWASVIPPGTAVHFRVTSKKSKLYHEDGIAERLERSLFAAVSGLTTVRAPSTAEALEDDVTKVPPVLRIVVRVHRDVVTLSADAAGGLLHRRGWRQAVAKAPMRETLAATLLLASGWTPTEPLLDPMCGSGTIIIEAALMARRMAPGRARRFAAEAWPGIAEATWPAARARAAAQELPRVTVPLVGTDRDAGAITASMENAERAGVAGDVEFVRGTLSRLPHDDGTGWIVTNPPYGTRIGERTALRDLYASLGHLVTQRRPQWHLAMISADRMLEGQLGFPLREVLRTTNGGLPVHVMTTSSTAHVNARRPPGRDGG